MPTFQYQALNAKGEAIVGEIDAEAVQLAIGELEARGLSVQSISLALPATSLGDLPRTFANEAGPPTPASARTSGVDAEHKMLEDHMALVLAQGKAIAPALAAYAEEIPSRRGRRELRTVSRVLERGNVQEATAALAALPEYWIPLLSSAASSSDPGRVLRQFVEESQRADELRRQWWLTLTYPVIVALIAIAVLAALSFWVTPAFRDIFNDFGLQLPALTRIYLAISGWITSAGAIVVFVPLLLAALWFIARRRRLRAVGGILGDRLGAAFGASTAIAELARFTGDLLEGGLEPPNALRVAGSVTRKPRLRRAAWQLADDLTLGSARAVRAATSPLSATVVFAMTAEMPKTSRIRLLKEVSGCYAERTRQRLSWTHGIVGPIAILAVGVVVGLTVLSLFLPLVDLINNLSS